MYFQLDDIRFQGLHGPSALGYKLEARIEETPLIFGKSSLLKIGDALDQYKLDFKLHYDFVNVPGAITALKDKMRAGLVCAFVDGNGLLIGDFIIKSLNVADLLRNPTGELLAAELQVELIEYVPLPGTDPARTRDFEVAAAIAENGAVPAALDPLPGSDSAEIMEELLTARANARAAALAAQNVLAVEANARGPLLTRIAATTKKIVAQGRKLVDIIDRGRARVGQIDLLRAQVASLAQVAEIMRDAAERGDVGALSNASTDLLNQANSAFDTTRPLNVLLIFRRL